MSAHRQDDPSPAELFDSFFRPALFAPWTRELLEYADPGPGDRVLDLACATGTVAEAVASRLGPEGRVVGVDLNPEMLEVARSRATAEDLAIEWRECDAVELDFPSGSFDLALCQQGVQFFDDPVAALRETRRTLVDGGRLVLNVWQPLERHPVYRALLEAEAEHLDAPLEDVAKPFTFGDAERLRSTLDAAGYDDIAIDERTLDVEFGEPDTFVALTVMAGAAVVPELTTDDPEVREELVRAVASRSRDVLEAHRHGDRVRFPTPNYLAEARA